MADAVKDLLNNPANPAPAVSNVAPPIPAPAPTPTPVAEPIVPAPAPTPVIPEVPAPPISPIPAAPAEPPVPEPATPPAPAPEPVNDNPTPADGRTDADSDGVVRKKIIKPLEHPTDNAQAPDLNALLAKEGITDFDKDEQPGAPASNGPSFNDVPANNAAHADLPHPPGHVISPNPVSADGKPIDPNSISL